jgi:hypothetical protein
MTYPFPSSSPPPTIKDVVYVVKEEDIAIREKR